MCASIFQNYWENLWKILYLPTKGSHLKRSAKDLFDDVYEGKFSPGVAHLLTRLIESFEQPRS